MNENEKGILIVFAGASLLFYWGYNFVKRPARARELYNYYRKDYKYYGDPPSEIYFRVAGAVMLVLGAFLIYIGIRIGIEIISTHTD